MAKFCRYCGRQLADGEVCTCTAEPVNVPNVPPRQEAPAVPQEPVAPMPEVPVQEAVAPVVSEVPVQETVAPVVSEVPVQETVAPVVSEVPVQETVAPVMPEAPVQEAAVPVAPQAQQPAQQQPQPPVQQPQPPVVPVTANTFCRYCGRPLANGEVCTCTAPQGFAPQGFAPQGAAPQGFAPQGAAPQGFAPQEGIPSGYGAPGYGAPGYGAPVYRAPSAPGPVGQYLSKMWKTILEVFKHPFSAGSKFVSECDFKTALGFIVMQSLAVALLVLSFPMKINGIFKEAMNQNSGGGEEAREMLDKIKFPSVATFFVTFFATFAMACLFALLLFALIRIAKKDTDYKHMLCVSGLHCLTSTPFILVGFFLSLIMQYSVSSFERVGNDPMAAVGTVFNPLLWPLLIAFAGLILARFVSISVVAAGTNATRDNLVYVLFFTEVVMTIAFFLVLKICLPMCLPDWANDALEGNMNTIDHYF